MMGFVIAVENQNLRVDVIVNSNSNLDDAVSDEFWSAIVVEAVPLTILSEGSIDDSHGLEMSWRATKSR
jgi:hypothetical protein